MTLIAQLLWGLIATVVMTTVLQGSQGLGLSRLSLPFLVGTCFTGRRSHASVAGFVLYFLGGWAFALGYVAVFGSVTLSPWLLGPALGLVNALFLLTVVLPILPYVHPRVASEHDEPRAARRLEPPGFLGLNYGYRTPLTTVLGHVLFGAVLALGYALAPGIAG